MEFSKRLTDNARDVLAHAEILARTTGASYIGTEHLLLGILSQESSVGAQILHSTSMTFDRVKDALALKPSDISLPIAPAKGFSETAKLTMRMSIELASEFHQDFCGTEHILFSLLSQKNARVTTTLLDMNVNLPKLLAELESHLEHRHSEYHEKEEGISGNMHAIRQTRSSFLNKFGRNLTTAAAEDELDPVIGREREIDRIITILSRRTKNNPVLIGEAGVGKTAVIEGLAQRIATGNVPNRLLDKKIYLLDIAAMVAGTKYRGEFEERLKRVIGEVKNDRNLIIFIDELHILMGAGAAEGSMDAVNILKPALARGEFCLIGATTLDEYRKVIEKDTALTRRLQSVLIEAPNARDTVRILTGLAPKYEDHHNVKLSPAVIEEAVRLSERYLPERHQPDKALDIIDEAAARAHSKETHFKGPHELKNYKNELKQLTEQMEKAVAREDYEQAALTKMRISRLKEKITEAEQIPEQNSRILLKLSAVASAVSAMTGVPLEQLQRSEAVKLAKLEKYLSKSIIGQNHAIAEVAQAIRRSRAGIANGKRPIGSFVFLGPTGVGKTELAQVLAREVFGSNKSLIKIDMSEFSERHTASRLLGAPAGYVGYDDGNHLTEKIRRQPYSVVLFDEIEKAHPDIFNLLLQILEDGRLTDGHGRSVDFSNTVVILTSNIGAEAMARENVLGFTAVTADEKEDLAKLHRDNQIAGKKKLRELMRPELINRFDAIVTFDSLSRKEVSQILDLMLDDLNQRLASKGIGILVGNPARKLLIKKGYDPKFGARPLRRTVQNELENLIAHQIIEKKIKRGDIIRANAKNGQITLVKYKESQTVKA